MRKSYLLIAGAGAVLLAACSGGKKDAMNDELQKELELASSSDGITLANSSPTQGQQVISAIERTIPPARKPAASAPVRRHKPAPKQPPQVAEYEPQSVAPEPGAADPAPVSPRPHPVAVSYPSGPSSGGDDGNVDRGSTAGSVIGSILGAVIRGGVVGGDVDRCDPRTDGRRQRNPGVSILINQRIPGRIGGATRPGTVPRRPHF